tara:strand:+ start:969 stop:1355 length:387 start_codon:yes stop_codon:yes gene_type:complete
MAHFAKIGNGNIVEQVLVVHNDVATSESAGENFLNNLYGTSDTWKQTSYNTTRGTHLLGGTPFRKNYASVGGVYDSNKDAFIPKQPYDSWVLNETTCTWDSPVPLPDDGKIYYWDEDTISWIAKVVEA